MSSTESPWHAHNEILDRILDHTRRIAFSEAQILHDLAALLAEPPPLGNLSESDKRRWLEHEVGAALHLHPSSAGDRIALAEQLVAEFPQTLKMLEAGHLTYRHARAVSEACVDLTSEQRSVIDDDVVPDGFGLSVGEFVKMLDKAVHEVAPKVVEDRRQQEIDERGVWVRGTRNGTLTLRAVGLDPIAGAALMNRLNSMADTLTVEDETTSDTPVCRTPDQRRADALLSLATGVGPGADGSVRPPVGINVCLALSTLSAAMTSPQRSKVLASHRGARSPQHRLVCSPPIRVPRGGG